ncbi:MAG: hypothetical protein ACKVRP_14930 [Bacteroidota bacterium]
MGGKAALIFVMGFGFILSYVSLNLNSMATQTVGNMAMYNHATASHDLASAGANVGLSKFYQDTSWYGSMTQTFTSGPFRGKFTVSTTALPGNLVRLRSVSTYEPDPSTSLHDTVEVFFSRTKEQSFSMFAWMTNDENGVNWINGDTVWGRVHSNSTLTINGKPTFYEKVTTTKNFNPKVGKSPNNAIFKKGYETGVSKIDFPTNLNELITASTSGGRRYPGTVWLTISAGTGADDDGKVYVRSTSSGPIIDSIQLNDPMFNGAIVGNSRVNIQGTLDGRLTIGSLTDVYIQNDVVYANQNTATSNDMLGIVAESNVVVANNAANNSHCQIQASIFSRTSSFTAENYSTRGVAGELRLTGSIVQNIRGPVGTFSGSTITSGFSKRYRYDTRLADAQVRPPFFPGFLVKTLAIANWWESYRVPSFH